MTPKAATLLLFVCALSLAPPSAAQIGERFLVVESPAPNPAGDVLEVAAATGQFTRFLAAVEAAGYADTLRGAGPFTVFAPTDEAFAHMNPRALDRLMQPAQRDELAALLAYHVVRGRLTSEGLHGRVTTRNTASGHPVTLDGRDGLRVNGQLVVMPDIEASNGVIHGLNTVLSPPVMVARR